MESQIKKAAWYIPQWRDFIPFYGIENWSDRIPREERMKYIDIFGTYALIASQTTILLGVSIYLEKLF